MSSADGPPSPSGGLPPPDESLPAPTGPSPSARRRWRIALLVGVAAVCAGVIAAAVALRPREPAGYGPELQADVEAACRRAAPDVDDPDAACGCAYGRLAGFVPFERLVDLDDEVREGGRVPPELARAVADCRADHNVDQG